MYRWYVVVLFCDFSRQNTSLAVHLLAAADILLAFTNNAMFRETNKNGGLRQKRCARALVLPIEPTIAVRVVHW